MHIHNPNLHSDQKLNKDKNEFNNEDKNSNEIIGESKTVNQIKNISQERDLKPKIQNASENKDRIMIKSFDDLLQFCTSKKEVKLKYELENNVNLVSFENKRIEISFNEKLDQGFLKDLSNKLFEWTNERWIISLTKSQGQLSINEQKISEKNKKIYLIKETEIYKSMVEKFSDAELIDIKNLEKDN
jgi:DNA polymerase-3 subunit gamma/tau